MILDNTIDTKKREDATAFYKPRARNEGTLICISVSRENEILINKDEKMSYENLI